MIQRRPTLLQSQYAFTTRPNYDSWGYTVVAMQSARCCDESLWRYARRRSSSDGRSAAGVVWCGFVGGGRSLRVRFLLVLPPSSALRFDPRATLKLWIAACRGDATCARDGIVLQQGRFTLVVRDLNSRRTRPSPFSSLDGTDAGTDNSDADRARASDPMRRLTRGNPKISNAYSLPPAYPLAFFDWDFRTGHVLFPRGNIRSRFVLFVSVRTEKMKKKKTGCRPSVVATKIKNPIHFQNFTSNFLFEIIYTHMQIVLGWLLFRC